jgi:hypothetical protein
VLNRNPTKNVSKCKRREYIHHQFTILESKSFPKSKAISGFGLKVASSQLVVVESKLSIINTMYGSNLIVLLFIISAPLQIRIFVLKREMLHVVIRKSRNCKGSLHGIAQIANA